ncbi:MAG: recombinase family protein [Cyanobacteriota bacterium]
MANFAYLRISSTKQNLENQFHEIIQYCKRKDLTLDINKNIFQECVSTKKQKKDRLELMKLLEAIKNDDTLIVCELSRLGRDTVEVLQTVQDLLKKNIELRLLKENLVINGSDSISAKLILPLLSALNDVERQRLSERTKSALDARKAKGLPLGRPQGSLGKSKLDEHQKEIKDLLKKNVSVTSIAKIIDTSRQNLSKYIRIRKLKITDI